MDALLKMRLGMFYRNEYAEALKYFDEEISEVSIEKAIEIKVLKIEKVLKSGFDVGTLIKTVIQVELKFMDAEPFFYNERVGYIKIKF